jgi:hypothetical protein
MKNSFNDLTYAELVAKRDELRRSICTSGWAVCLAMSRPSRRAHYEEADRPLEHHHPRYAWAFVQKITKRGAAHHGS